MRIISGAAKGKKLETMIGTDVRPTTDRVKESLFNILQFRLAGCKMLDLFAGSGQIGLEAHSRGAALAVCVDASKKANDVIRRNADHIGVDSRFKLVNTNYERFLESNLEKYDIIYLDPPYGQGILSHALPLCEAHLRDGGLLICEHPEDENLPERIGEMMLEKLYRYGKICLTVYVKQAEKE